MSKLIKMKERSTINFIEQTKRRYKLNYYNAWLNKYRVNGLEYQERDYFFNKLWFDGCIWFGKKNGVLYMSGFAPAGYNYLRAPVKVNLVNEWANNIIPKETQDVDKDGTLLYLMPSKETIENIVDWYIERIVSAEVLINVNVDTLKLPYLIATTPDTKQAIEEIMNKILAGESVVNISTNDIQNIKTLINNSPYILDKLMQYKKERENELKTFFGIDNYNTQEKSQYINKDTTNSNNEEIETGGCVFEDRIKEFFERTNKLLGTNLSIELKHKQEAITEETEEEEEGSNND